MSQRINRRLLNHHNSEAAVLSPGELLKLGEIVTLSSKIIAEPVNFKNLDQGYQKER